jgi:hypothetical protein
MLTDAETNEWMDEYIWPEVIELLLNDACFKLIRHVFPQTDKGIDPLNFFLLNGYITFQLMDIRRLCETTGMTQSQCGVCLLRRMWPRRPHCLPSSMPATRFATVQAITSPTRDIPDGDRALLIGT